MRLTSFDANQSHRGLYDKSMPVSLPAQQRQNKNNQKGHNGLVSLIKKQEQQQRNRKQYIDSYRLNHAVNSGGKNDSRKVSPIEFSLNSVENENESESNIASVMPQGSLEQSKNILGLTQQPEILKTATFAAVVSANQSSSQLKLSERKSMRYFNPKQSSTEGGTAQSSLQSIRHQNHSHQKNQEQSMSLTSSRRYRNPSEAVLKNYKQTQIFNENNDNISQQAFQLQSQQPRKSRLTVASNGGSFRGGQSQNEHRTHQDPSLNALPLFIKVNKGNLQAIPPVIMQNQVKTVSQAQRKQLALAKNQKLAQKSQGNKLLQQHDVQPNDAPQKQPMHSLEQMQIVQLNSLSGLDDQMTANSQQQPQILNSIKSQKDGVKMDELIKEFKEYQHVTTKGAELTSGQLLKQILDPEISAASQVDQQNGHQKNNSNSNNQRYQKLTDVKTANTMKVYAAQNHQQVLKHPHNSNNQQFVDKPNQQIQQQINKTSRIYGKISNLRKSFEKMRPDLPSLQAKDADHPDGINKTEANLKEAKFNVLNGDAEKLVQQKPTPFSNSSSSVYQRKQNNSSGLSSQNKTKSTSQKRQVIKIVGSTDNLSLSSNVNAQQSKTSIPRVSTANRAQKTKNNHLVIKNLIITNANLQNCNVFIQNSSGPSGGAPPQAYQDRHQSNSSPININKKPTRMAQTNSFDSSYIPQHNQNNKNIPQSMNLIADQQLVTTPQNKQQQLTTGPAALVNYSNHHSVQDSGQKTSSKRQQASSSIMNKKSVLSVQRSNSMLKRAKTANKTTNLQNNIDKQKQAEQEDKNDPAAAQPSSIINDMIPIFKQQSSGSNTNMQSRRIGGVSRATNELMQVRQHEPNSQTEKSTTRRQGVGLVAPKGQTAKHLKQIVSVTTPNNMQQRSTTNQRLKEKHQQPPQQQNHAINKAQSLNSNSNVQNNNNNNTSNNNTKKTMIFDSSGGQYQQSAQKKTFNASVVENGGFKSPSSKSLQVSQEKQQQYQSSVTQQEGKQVTAAKNSRSLNLRNFVKQIEPLGVGHFGKVWHVKYVPKVAAAETAAAPQDDISPTLASQEEIKSNEDVAYLDQARKQSLQSINTNSQKSFYKNSYSFNQQQDQGIQSILPLNAAQGQYALKMVELQQLTKQKQIEHLVNERDILCLLQNRREQDLAATCFPKLYSTFKSQRHVNFLMEPIDGVTLFEFQRELVCIKLEQVKFFAAKTLVLLDYLHQQRIVFRDLKSENIMIDQNTCDIKLVDFGFAKDLTLSSRPSINDRTFTKCGTPGYTAPEVLLQDEGSSMFNIKADVHNKASASYVASPPPKVISSKGSRGLATQDFLPAHVKGYGMPADVWSWGVLICELIGGFNPFQGQSVQETFENISRISINWPRNLDSASSQMLQAIFQRDPALRPTLQSIKRSSFFSGVNWNRLEDTFEQERFETKSQVQEMVKKSKKSKSPSNSNASPKSWVPLYQQAEEEKSPLTPYGGYPNNGRRRKLTETQIKTIHDALADF